MLRTNSKVFLLIFILLSATVLPQDKGDKYYDKGEYFKAIPYYKKQSRSSDASKRLHALIRLGNSYKNINEYQLAEDAYRHALDQNGDVPAELYYNYAQILKVNNRYEEAAEQYANYLKLSPNDVNAKNARKF